MICGQCDRTDKLAYLSYPQKVKCTVTGDCQLLSHECDVKVKSEWVRTDESMPCIGEEVLITVQYEDVAYVEFGAAINENEFYNEVADSRQGKDMVVAWMPLPFAYGNGRIMV